MKSIAFYSFIIVLHVICFIDAFENNDIIECSMYSSSIGLCIAFLIATLVYDKE
jgi:hypothetical protein